MSPNTFLTSQEITRNALEILHAKLNFVGSINQQYDSSFAKKGAKIGSQLRIRLPNKYTVSTGRKYEGQGTQETSETLTVATQKHVDSQMYSDDLALSVDDFRQRILEPQMTVLAAAIEFDVMSMTLDVANSVGTPGTVPGSTANQALLPWLQAKQRLDENLAGGSGRCVQMDGDANSYTVNGLASLFHPSGTINKQFTEGWLGHNSGMDYYHNTLLPRLDNGSATDGTVNGAGQGGDGSLILAGQGNLGTIKKGQIFTLAGVYDVHDETKQSWGRLKQFVVTADAIADGAGAATIAFAPKIITEGAYQNASALPANGAAITWAGAASTNYGLNLAYCKDAFAFVSADLDIPNGVDMKYRAKMDDISMRFIRWFDGDEDEWKSRFDVLYGYKTLREVEACRIWGG
jgi:hypothetical protein